MKFSCKDDCAASIHVKCATQMQQDLENGASMCSSIRNFIQCYESPENPCTTQIYTDYVNFLDSFAAGVAENPGVMPGC